MKLQKNNKFSGQVTKSLSTILLSAVILSGNNSQIDIIPSETNDIIVKPSTTRAVKMVEIEQPVDISMLDEPIETEVPISEYEKIDTDSNFSFNKLRSIIFKMPDGNDKIVFSIVDSKTENLRNFCDYYDIYTGIKLLAIEKVPLYEGGYENSILFVNPYFEDSEFLVSYNQLDLINEYFRNVVSSYTLSDMLGMYSELHLPGTASDKVSYSLEKYQQYYEDIVPDEYKVSTADLFPELEDAKVKSLG